MLILTRRVGEVVRIKDDITVTVLGVRDNGQQLRLGVKAPAGVPVVCEERPECGEDSRPVVA